MAHSSVGRLLGQFDVFSMVFMAQSVEWRDELENVKHALFSCGGGV